jgi:hypothetical protein
MIAATSPKVIDSPSHWQKRAEETRTLADEMRDRRARRMMLRLAADYELLARRATERTGPQPHWWGLLSGR